MVDNRKAVRERADSTRTGFAQDAVMKPLAMEIASRTDKGLVREHNEDSVVVIPDQGLAVLADGMGGLNAGEVASHLAAEFVAKDLLMRIQAGGFGPQDLVRAVERANEALRKSVEQNPSHAGMATTIVVLVFSGDQALLAHLGDSRIYRITPDFMECLTTDHSMIQELVDQGLFFSLEEAHNAGIPSNVLTRGLGVEPEVRVDLAEMALTDDDIYLLCSDGLTNMLPDEKIHHIVSAAAGDLHRAADQLLAGALEEGGIDNVSLILARPRRGELK